MPRLLKHGVTIGLAAFGASLTFARHFRVDVVYLVRGRSASPSDLNNIDSVTNSRSSAVSRSAVSYRSRVWRSGSAAVRHCNEQGFDERTLFAVEKMLAEGEIVCCKEFNDG